MTRTSPIASAAPTDEESTEPSGWRSTPRTPWRRTSRRIPPTATPAIHAIRPSEITTGSPCRSDRGTLRSVKRSGRDWYRRARAVASGLPRATIAPRPSRQAPSDRGRRGRGCPPRARRAPARRAPPTSRSGRFRDHQRRLRRLGVASRAEANVSVLGPSLNTAPQLHHAALRLVDEPPDLRRPRSAEWHGLARGGLRQPAQRQPPDRRVHLGQQISLAIAPEASAPDSASASAASPSSVSASSANSACVSAIVPSAPGPISRSTGSTSLRILLRA